VKNNRIENAKGSVCLFFAFALAGTSVISARYLSGKLGVFTITAVSLLLAFALLAALCAPKIVSTAKEMGAKEWGMLFLQAFFGIFLFRMFLLQGLLRTSTAEAGILTGAAPALTALLALTFLKERVYAKGIAGIFSTVGGILLIQGVVSTGGQFSVAHVLGNLLVLCAAASESTFNILSRLHHIRKTERQGAPPDQTRSKSSTAKSFDPIVQTAFVTGIAGLLSMIPAFLENPLPALALLGVREWAAIVWYGIFVTALAFIFWYAGIKRSNASKAAAFSGMMTLMGLILSVTLLHEHTSWPQWTGGALIILGMILIGSRSAGAVKQEFSHNTRTSQSSVNLVDRQRGENT